MHPSRSFKLRILGAGLGLAVVVSGNAGAVSRPPHGPTLPKDPCGLIKAAEIQAALAPGTTVGSGVQDTTAAPLAVGCRYTWGPRTPQWGESSITINVMDASKAWPDLSTDQIRMGMLTSGNPRNGEEASEISGVGDAAVFIYKPHSYNATGQAYVAAKSLHVSVEYHGADKAAYKDKVTALLKQAVARL
jgi:hypothetical protein